MEAPKREPSEPKRAAEPQRFEPRLVEQTERGTLPLGLRRDVTRWGPILGGFAATIATAILLSVLGAAMGISPAPGQAGVASAITIWGVIVLLVSFFVGGYVAARGAAPGGWVSAVMNSSIVWAVTVVFIVLLAANLLSSLAGLIAVWVPSLFGPVPGAAAPGGTEMWAAFIGMVVALAAAIVGGLVGMRPLVESYGSEHQ